MDAAGDSDFPAAPRPAGPTLRPIGVHVLSEHVFCPRAALLAYESGPDSGDEEPCLGPRLDLFAEYDEHRFAEALHIAWGELRLWLTLLAPAILVVLLAWYFLSPVAALVASLPIFVLLVKCLEALGRIIALVRARAIFRAAAPVEIDLAPTEVRRVNWWSLRKAGFDCIKLADTLATPDGGLKGKPWRMLKKGNTIGIPVIRRHRGSQDWGFQHEVRLAAYCRLIENCEGRSSPFGVILFAGSYDCAIIPNSPALQMRGELALADAREFLEIQQRGTHIPAAPTDRRCAGCPYGAPVQFRRGKTESTLGEVKLTPYTTNSVRADGRVRGEFHCLCGDRFKWVPPHRDAVALGIAAGG